MSSACDEDMILYQHPTGLGSVVERGAAVISESTFDMGGMCGICGNLDGATKAHQVSKSSWAGRNRQKTPSLHHGPGASLPQARTVGGEAHSDRTTKDPLC